MHGLTDQIACFAIAYLMKSRRMRLAQAATHVRKRLPGVAPNFGTRTGIESLNRQTNHTHIWKMGGGSLSALTSKACTSPAFISQLTNFETTLFGDTDSVYLAEYVMETLPGWDASLEDVTKALREHDNDVAKAMDVLCPSTTQDE